MNAIDKMLKDANRELHQEKTEIVNTNDNPFVKQKDTKKLLPFPRAVKKAVTIKLTADRLEKLKKIQEKYRCTFQAVIDTAIDSYLNK